MKEKTKGVGIIVTLWEGCWRKIIYDSLAWCSNILIFLIVSDYFILIKLYIHPIFHNDIFTFPSNI